MNVPKKVPYILISLCISFIFCILWLGNQWVASFFSLVISMIALFITIISYVSEKLEKSKLPPWYFPLMLMLIFIPATIALLFLIIFDFQLDWMLP